MTGVQTCALPIYEIHAAKAAEGVPRVLVPGEREWEARRAAMAGGISLPPDVAAKLAEAAAMTGIALPG